MAYAQIGGEESYRAGNVPVEIQHFNGLQITRVDQRRQPPIDGLFVSLGCYQFDASRDAVVTIRCEDADDIVIADAIQFLPVLE